MTTNHIDSWFSVDILLGCYKMFIILDQARTKAYCQANYGVVPLSSEMAVQSLKTVRIFMSSASYAHWGVRYVPSPATQKHAAVLMLRVVWFSSINLSLF
jgi:hypothetical protein